MPHSTWTRRTTPMSLWSSWTPSTLMKTHRKFCRSTHTTGWRSTPSTRAGEPAAGDTTQAYFISIWSSTQKRKWCLHCQSAAVWFSKSQLLILSWICQELQHADRNHPLTCGTGGSSLTPQCLQSVSQAELAFYSFWWIIHGPHMFHVPRGVEYKAF